MKYEANQYRNSQQVVGFQRPRLYTMTEAAEELGTTQQALAKIATKYRVKPAFPPTPGKKSQYRISELRAALNKGAGVEVVIEKAIPIPPRHTATSKYMDVLAKMEPGDSVVIPQEDSQRIAQCAVRHFPDYKLVTRKEDDDTRRVWRQK